MIGNRIYGCDDCLAACPWNRFAGKGRLMAQHRRDDLDQADLIELLSLDEDGFRAKFRNTPIKRTKRRGFLRNVCVALGNIGDDKAIPALKRVQKDQESLISEHAKWALDQIGLIAIFLVLLVANAKPRGIFCLCVSIVCGLKSY